MDQRKIERAIKVIAVSGLPKGELDYYEILLAERPDWIIALCEDCDFPLVGHEENCPNCGGRVHWSREGDGADMPAVESRFYYPAGR